MCEGIVLTTRQVMGIGRVNSHSHEPHLLHRMLYEPDSYDFNVGVMARFTPTDVSQFVRPPGQ